VGFPEKLQKLLLNPDREMTVELLVQLDNGEVETMKAYRVQHNNSRGPFKGGLRYHPDVDLDDVRRYTTVSFFGISQLKKFGKFDDLENCCDGYTLRRSKGRNQRRSQEVQRDRSRKDDAEIGPGLYLSRQAEFGHRVLQEIKGVIGPYEDIPAPDMNTDARVMAWFFDEYSKYCGFSPGVVTGKPVHLHGSLGRESATGRGVVDATGELLKHQEGKTVEGKKVVIQVFFLCLTPIYEFSGLWKCRFFCRSNLR